MAERKVFWSIVTNFSKARKDSDRLNRSLEDLKETTETLDNSTVAGNKNVAATAKKRENAEQSQVQKQIAGLARSRREQQQNNAVSEAAARAAQKVAAAHNAEQRAALALEASKRRLADAEKRHGRESQQYANALLSVQRRHLEVESATNRHANALENLERSQRNTESSNKRLSSSFKNTDSQMLKLVKSGALLKGTMVGLKFGAIGAGVSGLVGALSSLSAGILSLLGPLGSMAGALAALPQLASVAAGAIGTVLAAFSGIGDALKAGSALRKDGAATARAERANAEAVIQAQRALRNAREASADSARDNARAVREASRAVVDAQKNEYEAAKRLSEARQQATRDIQDMQKNLRDLEMSERGASLSVEEARQRLQETMADPGANSVAQRQAQLAYDEAIARLDDVKQEQAQAAKDTKKAQEKGVDGSDSVIAAQQDEIDSTLALQKANEELADSLREQRRAARDTAEAIGDAARALRDANQTASDGAPALKKYNDAMKELSPAGKNFVKLLLTMQGQLKKLKFAAQEGLLPGLGDAIKGLLPLMPLLEKGLFMFGQTLGEIAQMISGIFVNNMGILGRLLKSNNKILGMAGKGFGNILEALLNLMDAARPFTEWLAESVLGWTEYWKQISIAGNKTGSTAKKLEQTKKVLQIFGGILKNLWNTFKGIARAGNDLGVDLLTSFEKITKGWADWTNSVKGQNSLKEWFDAARPGLHEMGLLIGAIVKAFFELGKTDNSASIFKAIREDLLPSIVGLIKAFQQSHILETFIGILGDVIDVFTNLVKHSHSLEVFAGIIGTFVKALKKITGNDVGAAALTAVGAALASIAAVRFIGAITGVNKLVRALGKMKKKKAEADALAAATQAAGGAPVGGKRRAAGPTRVTGGVGGSRKAGIGSKLKSGAGAALGMIGIGGRGAAGAGAAAGGAEAAAAAAPAGLAAGPFLAIAAAVAAVTIALVILYKKWKPFHDAVNEIAKAFWENLKPGLDAIAKSFKNDVLPAVGEVGKSLSDLWNIIGPILMPILEKAMWLWGKYGVILATFAGKYLAFLLKTLAFVITYMAKFAAAFVKAIVWVVGKGKEAWDAIKDVFSGPITWVKDKIGGWISKIGAGVKTAIEGIVSIAETAWKLLEGVFASPIEWVINTAIDEYLIDNVNKVLKAIGLKDNIGLSHIGPVNFATGGPVKGSNRNATAMGFAKGGGVPGQGNRDSVAAMLMPGEFVMRKDAVKRIGVSQLAAMNENSTFRGQKSGRKNRDSQRNGGFGWGGIGDALGSAWDHTGGAVIGAGVGLAKDAWGVVKTVGGKVIDLAKMGAAAGLDALFSPLRGKIKDYSKDHGIVGSIIGGPPLSLMDTLVNWVRGADQDTALTTEKAPAPTAPQTVVPGTVLSPKNKARGGPVKFARGGLVQGFHSGGPVLGMKAGAKGQWVKALEYLEGQTPDGTWDGTLDKSLKNFQNITTGAPAWGAKPDAKQSKAFLGAMNSRKTKQTTSTQTAVVGQNQRVGDVLKQYFGAKYADHLKAFNKANGFQKSVQTTKTTKTTKGSGNLGKAQSFAKSQAGKPYGWGKAGPASYDCSGFQSAITNVIKGKNPYSRLFATGSMASVLPKMGFKPGAGSDYTVGWRTGDPGHTSGRLGGLNAESAGGVGVRVGGSARSPMSFPHVMHLDTGGKKTTKGSKTVGTKSLKSLLTPGSKVKIPGVKGWSGGLTFDQAKKQFGQSDASMLGWGSALGPQIKKLAVGKKAQFLQGYTNKRTDFNNSLDQLNNLLGLPAKGAKYDSETKAALVHALDHSYGIPHDALAARPWQTLSASESALLAARNENARSEKWSAAMQQIATWGFQSLLEDLFSKGSKDDGAYNTAIDAASNKTVAGLLNDELAKKGSFSEEDMQNIIKLLGFLQSSADGYSLRDIARYLGLSDFDTVRLWENGSKAGKFNSLPAAKMNKVNDDVRNYRAGTFYAATGGEVPGTGSGDTVPAMLTPGEFVIKKKAAKALGLNRLMALNNAQHFANGGLVRSMSPKVNEIPTLATTGVTSRKLGDGQVINYNYNYDVDIHNPVAEEGTRSMLKMLQRQATLKTVAGEEKAS